MSALPRSRSKPVVDEETRTAFRRIIVLAVLALGISLLLGAFAGILLFVAGLATFAAYAATHPDHT